VPGGLVPDGLVPGGLVPDGLVPGGLLLSGLVSSGRGGQVSMFFFRTWNKRSRSDEKQETLVNQNNNQSEKSHGTSR